MHFGSCCNKLRVLHIVTVMSKRYQTTTKARIYLGDSTFEETYIKLLHRVEATGGSCQQQLIAPSKADVLVTDPPYCLLERRRSNGDLRDPKKRQRKLDQAEEVPRFANIEEYRKFTRSWLSLTIRHALKPSAKLVVWTNALGKSVIKLMLMEEFKYHFIGEYHWAKYSSDNIRENSTKNEILLRIYESALIFQPAHSVENILATVSPKDKCIPWSVISGYHDRVHDETESHEFKGHPCQKPFTALEPLLRQWTSPGDLIFDPFAGSGAILTAALKIGDRHVLGIEAIEKWVDSANIEIQGLVSEHTKTT